MIQLSEFFQYSFVLILKRKCLVGASRVRCRESGTPSTIIYTRWSSRRYELGCNTPVTDTYSKWWLLGILWNHCTVSGDSEDSMVQSPSERWVAFSAVVRGVFVTCNRMTHLLLSVSVGSASFVWCSWFAKKWKEILMCTILLSSGTNGNWLIIIETLW